MIAVFLVGAAAIVFLLDAFYAGRWMKALSVRVAFSEAHIYAGETGELTELIENRKNLPVPVLEVGFRIQRGLQFTDAENIQESDFIYKRDLFAVLGMERILRRYHVTARRRGYYTASQLSVHAPSLFFGQEFLKDMERQEDDPGLYVYAARMKVDTVLKAVETLCGELESTRRVFEDPFSFSGIRSYTIQDPMKTINWKASARTGSLMVNTFTSVRSLRIFVVLDVFMDMGAHAYDLREMAVSAAASLCRALSRMNQDAVLTVNAGRGTGGTVFSGRSGADRLAREEIFLTEDFEAADMTVIPLPDFLPLLSGERQDRDMDGVFVFISANDSAFLRGRIREWLGQGRSGLLVVPVRSADKRRPEREGSLSILPLIEKQEGGRQ